MDNSKEAVRSGSDVSIGPSANHMMKHSLNSDHLVPWPMSSPMQHLTQF